jgi:hypothetical protein
MKLPEDIWGEIFSHYHTMDINRVCSLFNKIMKERRHEYLRKELVVYHRKKCDHYYKKPIKVEHAEEHLKGMLDTSGYFCESSLHFQTKNISISNKITNEDEYRHWHAQEVAITMKIRGGTCSWIYGEDNCRGGDCRKDWYDKDDTPYYKDEYGKERYTGITNVNNKTSWPDKEFIEFCTRLITGIMPYHKEFYMLTLTDFNWNDNDYLTKK